MPALSHGATGDPAVDLPCPRTVLAVADAPLALARAGSVARDLGAAWPGLTIDLLRVPAGGGVSLAPGSETAASAAADRLRAVMRAGRADVAVHGLDHLPLAAEGDLVIGAVPMRRDPRDALVSRTGKVLAYLPTGARVGAGTLGRGAQLLRRRSDLAIVPIDGDVSERLERLRGTEFDAVVLSAAALDHLGLLERVTEYFDTDQIIPSPGQGALALERRADDATAAALLAPIHDELSAYAVTAERTCLARLGAPTGACVGIFAVTDGDRMFIHGIVSTPDGTRTARLRWTGPWRQAEEVGATLSELLLSAGAREILGGQPIPPTINFAERHRQWMAEEWGGAYPPEEA